MKLDVNVAFDGGQFVSKTGSDNPPNSALYLNANPSSYITFQSNLQREIYFAAHHGTHHLAMMKGIAMGPAIGMKKEEFDAGFGVAESTKRFVGEGK